MDTATGDGDVTHLRGHNAETTMIGAVAAQALDEIHSAIYGQAPESSRSWTDGDAILLVARLPSRPEPAAAWTPLTAIQRIVSATVYRRTGVLLRTGGANFDTGRALAVFAFERAATPADPEPAQPLEPVAGPVHGAE